MWFNKMILIPVLIPTIIVKTYCEINDNSDIIVQYSGHAEADYRRNNILESSTSKEDILNATQNEIKVQTSNPPKTELAEETESVIFVPNDSPVQRVEDHYDRNPVKLEDLMMKKAINDITDKHILVETEAPKDIVFIESKNNDHLENNVKVETSKDNKKKEKIKEVKSSIKLDCSKLDCNNSVNSICGEKKINQKIQNRLFLNECYFRKVNCNFKYEINRYVIVPINKCKNIGTHYEEKPAHYKRKFLEEKREAINNNDARRSFSSRRSMSMTMNGQFCSHSCPISCPDDYEPECAISATGQRKVFMNHCKLDDNSCLFGVVWHRRPLSECVGGKKADMRQNRYFIDWMRRVGIIDNKGKLVLE